MTDTDRRVSVAAGADRFGEARGMGITSLTFKLSERDTDGALFMVEQINHARGGPPRHVHPNQDEWFYALEGEFVLEVGGTTTRLCPGDSLLAPRRVPHAWAFVGEGTGRLLIAFTPAGKMEPFFREVTKANAMPPTDPELWRRHEMEVVGPPLDVAALLSTGR